MKKPGKPKPKRRARKIAPAGRAAPTRQAAGDREAGLPSAPANAPVNTAAKVHKRPSSVSYEVARQASPRQALHLAARTIPAEDRSAFALLLLPFLIVALSLTMMQSRRTPLPALPEIAFHAPAERPAIAPPAADPVAVAPARIAAGGQTPHAPTDMAEPAISAPPPAPSDQASPTPAAVAEPLAVQPAPPTTVVKDDRVDPPANDITVANLEPRKPVPLALPEKQPEHPAPEPPVPAQATCTPSPDRLASFANVGRLSRATPQPRLVGVDAATFGRRLAAAAIAQTQDLVIYTARYQPMAYPMGDVMPLYGACIDVVIRAYRALGIDLQEEVQRGRPTRGDTNIDHRRTENMRRFLERAGASLPVTTFPEDYRPGDIVTYNRPFSRVSTSHIAVVTDVLAPSRRPMIVHNRGYGPQLEDALFVDRITGHYRYMGPPPQAADAKPVTPAGERSAASVDRIERASYPASTAAIRAHRAAERQAQ